MNEPHRPHINAIHFYELYIDVLNWLRYQKIQILPNPPIVSMLLPTKMPVKCHFHSFADRDNKICLFLALIDIVLDKINALIWGLGKMCVSELWLLRSRERSTRACTTHCDTHRYIQTSRQKDRKVDGCNVPSADCFSILSLHFRSWLAWDGWHF